MDENKYNTIDEAKADFEDNICELVKIASYICVDNPVLATLKVLIQEIKDLNCFDIYNRCQKKVHDVRQYIRKRDDSYFLNRDYSAYIKKDDNENFILTIVSMIKTEWNSLDKPTKNCIWRIANRLADAEIFINGE
jgi:hypothetical protein